MAKNRYLRNKHSSPCLHLYEHHHPEQQPPGKRSPDALPPPTSLLALVLSLLRPCRHWLLIIFGARVAGEDTHEELLERGGLYTGRYHGQGIEMAQTPVTNSTQSL